MEFRIKTWLKQKKLKAYWKLAGMMWSINKIMQHKEIKFVSKNDYQLFISDMIVHRIINWLLIKICDSNKNKIK